MRATIDVDNYGRYAQVRLGEPERSSAGTATVAVHVRPRRLRLALDVAGLALRLLAGAVRLAVRPPR